MFFSPERRDFFKPLTSKYREQIVHCLCLLYQRLYGSQADYGHSLSKDQVLDIFDESLVRAPVLDTGDDQDEPSQRFRTHREQANWILKQLIEFGWMTKQVDAATLQSTYPFTRIGRLFTQPLVESENTQVRTRHRNTRNTLNALEAFIARGEVYDLLDAYEYSERIVTDFTDVIADLEERKRQLVREVEAVQLVQEATDQFFDFMEKRFQPDISVRLSADSVEKHRDQIARVVKRIRKKDKDFKAKTEAKLREQVPELVQPNQSVLWLILDTIEQRMGNAAEIMLPALRHALHSFTKRADIIIRQLSYLSSQRNDDVAALCQKLRSNTPEQQEILLNNVADHMVGMRLQLVDPIQIKLHERKRKRSVQTAVQTQSGINSDARRETMIQQLLDQAFTMDNKGLRDYVTQALNNDGRVSTGNFPVKGAHDLLAMAHAIEVGAVNNLSSDLQFIVQPTGKKLTTPYYHEVDEFVVELKESLND